MQSSIYTCRSMLPPPAQSAKKTNHLESCTPGTRQYKVVRTGTYQYILFWIRGGTRKGKIVHTSTDVAVLTYDISMAVPTGMYWSVLYNKKRYKEVQAGTKRYTVVQGTVQGGTRQYVLVCTGMYLNVLLGTRRYTKVQGDTCWYNEQYKTVCTGMYWYVLVCTGMYSTVQPGYAALRLNLLL